MGIGFSFGKSDKKEKSTTERTQDVTGTTTANTAGQTSGWGSSQASYWTPEQQQLASKLSGYLSGSWGQPTASQKTGLDAMQRAATGQGYADIVDPAAANALYAAIEKQTLEDILPKATDAIANQANLAGMLRSGQGLKMQLDNRNQIVNQLMQTLSGLKYQDEQQRRQIAQEREARQLPAGQALFSASPEQQTIQNIMNMLGIRGTTSETSQQAGRTSQQSIEDIARQLNDFIYQKGSGSASNTGFSLGF